MFENGMKFTLTIAAFLIALSGIAEEAPKKENTKANGESEYKRPNPENLRLFDDVWYWSFRG